MDTRMIGVIHYREINYTLKSSEIVIRDQLEGKNRHELEIMFQCAPDIEVVQQSGGHLWTLSRKGSSRLVHMQLDSDLEWHIIRGEVQPVIAGWYSSRLDYREPGCVLRGRGDRMLPCRIETSIVYESR